MGSSLHFDRPATRNSDDFRICIATDDEDEGGHPFRSRARSANVPAMEHGPSAAELGAQRGALSGLLTEPTGVSVKDALLWLRGFKARWAGQGAGTIEGVSLVVRVPDGQLRIVPLESVERVADPEREVAFKPSVEPHGFPRHRSLRRLDEGWRVDVSLDVPLMDADYWLARCHGFLVNAPGADVGVVDDVLYARGGEPSTLLIRTSGLRGQIVEVSTSAVVEIVPELKTLCIERGLERFPEEPERSSAWKAFGRRWNGSS
jgi:hypothetical protein